MSDKSKYVEACDAYEAYWTGTGFDCPEHGPDEWIHHTLAIAAAIEAACESERVRILDELENMPCEIAFDNNGEAFSAVSCHDIARLAAALRSLKS